MNKLETLLTLEELGVKKIIFEFSGSGDSGDIADRTYYSSLTEDLYIDQNKINSKIQNFIEEEVSNILSDIEDWYNNDGGGGHITIYIPEFNYKIQNYTNYMQQNYYSHDGVIKFKIK